MTTTTEVSDSLERVGSIFDMLDEICDHMDGFSSAGETWLSSITETLALGAMSCTKQKAKATIAPRSKRRDARSWAKAKKKPRARRG
jgi:hypothetical protein